VKYKESNNWIGQRKKQLVGGPNGKKVGLLGVDLQKLGASWAWSCTNVFGVTADLGSLSHRYFFLSCCWTPVD